MGHKNYSMFSRKVENDKNVNEEVKEPAIATAGLAQVAEPKQDKIIGIVDDCDRLNVRAKPDKDSAVLCVIDKTAVLDIDINNSTDEFYKVVTSVGIEGYCMKRFIVIQHVNE